MTSNKKLDQARELLSVHYGYSAFRSGQEKAILNVLEGKSTVVVMPTGGGKSLCYQLPALVLEGVTIVISPLISLMKDQVDSLIRVGIPATFINSAISPSETTKRLNEVKEGAYKLLYIAPERFYSQEFVDALSGIKVDLFAIDEAHCISHWGHDFRPSYLKLKYAIEAAGNPTVIALTATATPEVRQDIIKQLGLEYPEMIVTGFSRPNLQFGVIQANEGRKPQIVTEALSSMPDQPAIIYVGTRSRADQLVQHLLDNNIEAAAYHAGMEADDRKWIQEQFMSGKVNVIVATNAFGLGINKPNIRLVIHYDMPGTIEAYYQEAGRAGRDGKKSYCLLLHNSRDRVLQEFFIKGDNPPSESILDIYETLLNFEKDVILITYSELMKYISDDLPEMAIGTSLKLLEREGYVRRSHEKSGSAFARMRGELAEALEKLGPKAKKQRELLNKFYEKYKEDLRAGLDFIPDEIASLLEVKKEALMRMIRKLSESGVLDYQPPFKGTEIHILKRVDRSEVQLDFESIKAKLKSAYSKLDKMEEYTYHFNCRPQFILDYFGEFEAKACGRCDNCLDLGLSKSNKSRPIEKPSKTSYKYANNGKWKKKEVEYVVDDNIAPKAKLSTKLTQLETLDLVNRGLGLKQIAETRSLSEGTIVDHLCFLMEKRIPVDISRFVSKDKEKRISAVIKESGLNKLKELKAELGDDIDYDEIRLVIASKKILSK